jgi:amidase
VMRDFFGQNPQTDFVMEQTILKLRALGATIVDEIKLPDFLVRGIGPMHTMMIDVEFKAQIAQYLSTLRPGFPHTLEELVAKARDPKTAYTSPWKRDSMASMDKAVGIDDPIYLAAKNQGLALTTAVIEGLFTKYKVDAMIYPTVPRPAGEIGEARNPAAAGATGPANPAALANETGFPDVIVPAGMTPGGLPVTVSFFGPAWSEGKLLGYAYDFEQATHAVTVPKYTPRLASDVIGR